MRRLQTTAKQHLSMRVRKRILIDLLPTSSNLKFHKSKYFGIETSARRCNHRTLIDREGMSGRRRAFWLARTPSYVTSIAKHRHHQCARCLVHRVHCRVASRRRRPQKTKTGPWGPRSGEREEGEETTIVVNVRPNPQSRLKHVVCRPTVELSPSQRETGMHATKVASFYDVRPQWGEEP